MKKHLPPAPIEEQVRELLHARRGDWMTVVRECKISHAWLSKFSRNKIQNPGCRTMQHILDYLIRTQPKENACNISPAAKPAETTTEPCSTSTAPAVSSDATT